jgi:hypothetical protein
MKWHSGPPPSIGWWPASVRRDHTFLRWWDGERWSASAWAGLTAAQAAQLAEVAVPNQDEIRWTDRPAWWPERSKT